MLSSPALELSRLGTVQEIYLEWLRLWQRSGASPFQSPMWLGPWAENFTGANLFLFGLRDAAEELVAVAPFYEHESTLFLLGNGISDYLDICAAPGVGEEAAELLSACLAGRGLELNQLPAGSPLIGLGSAEPAEPCFVLDLEGGFVPARQCEKLRYYRRRAEKCGAVTIDSAAVQTVDAAMHGLFRLHQLRWAARGESGVLSDPAVEAFHRAAALNLARSGHLRLYTLALDGLTIGALYCFAGFNATYYYLSGFDPAFQHLSPGTILIGHAIECARSESHAAFDFLRGAEPYKIAWGARPQPAFRVVRSGPGSH